MENNQITEHRCAQSREREKKETRKIKLCRKRSTKGNSLNEKIRNEPENNPT